MHNMYLSNIKMIPKLTQSIRAMRTLGEPKKEVNTKSISIWKNIFGKYLLLTNTISSGVLMFFGDILSQEIEFRSGTLPQRYDYQRLCTSFLLSMNNKILIYSNFSVSMTMVGVSQGPMHHYIYKYLDIFLSKSDLKTVFKKIIFDQIVVSPIFIVSYFYAAGLFEGDSVKSTTDDLRDKFFYIYTVCMEDYI